MTAPGVLFLAASMALSTSPARSSAIPDTDKRAEQPENQEQGGQHQQIQAQNEQLQTQDPISQAKKLAYAGKYQLHLGLLNDAQSQCEAALTADPANATAKDCLDLAASMKIDEELNMADNLILVGQPSQASAMAANWVHSRATPAQQSRARLILSKARRSIFSRAWTALPEWIQQIVTTLLFIVVAGIMIYAARSFWRLIRTRTSFRRIIWNLLPLRELPGSTDGQKATDGLLDALARLGDELDRDLRAPKLLLLRPTQAADYEPALIRAFLDDTSLPSLVLAPAMKELRLEWSFHEVRLDEAVQNLQLKAAAGIDVGSLVRFLMTIAQWIAPDAPTITGSVEKRKASTDPMTTVKTEAQTGADQGLNATTLNVDTISIHIAARGSGVRSVSITTSSELRAGIDCVQLAAERAAFKFLIRMKHPEITNDEVNGLAALRQGASLFYEFAGTIPDKGKAATTRSSSLRLAAQNLEFFRSSIPVQFELAEDFQSGKITNVALSDPGQSESSPGQATNIAAKPPSIVITDENRQAILLAEGVAHALADGESARHSAISCFHQLRGWPGSAGTLSLRQQATYNEAVVRRGLGYYGQCVLMLTELLGDWIPGVHECMPATVRKEAYKPPIPEPIRFAARSARLAAFAQYNRQDWLTLPLCRADMLIDDAKQLLIDLEKVLENELIPANSSEIARYMHTEALRAVGHVELRRAIRGAASRFYDTETNRPTGLLSDQLNPNNPEDRQCIESLRFAISRMEECEQISPSCGLFCDLAESFLILKNFEGAQAYARHATLQASPSANTALQVCANLATDPDYERAFYLAAESFLLAKNEPLAKKYAERFPGTAKLDEFKALRLILEIRD
jgi:hypothetical protein